MKRVLSIILAIMLFVTALGGFAINASAATAKDTQYDYKITTDETISLEYTANRMFEFVSADKSIATVSAGGSSMISLGSFMVYSHSATVWPQKPGLVVIQAVDYSGYVLAESTVLVVEGSHQYETVVTYPTLTKNGYTSQKCKFCGHVSSVKNYTFPDVPNTLWSYQPIEYAVAKGWYSGYTNGNFGPSDMITRQDFVVVLARLAKVDLKKFTGKTTFPDVKAGSYYEAAVKWATKSGIVSGYNNGKFGVNDKITREQLVTILYNYAKKCGYNVSVPASAKNMLKSYTDANKIASYAKDAVIWALHKGIISGMTSTTIGPQNSASRGQVATILMNISKKGIMKI